MERIRTRCSTDSFHALCVAMNKNGDEVTIRRSDLKEVVDCHIRYGGEIPRRLSSVQGRQRLVINRLVLLSFVNQHGARCGHKGDGRSRQIHPGVWKYEVFK